jgi:hypothetical protein
MRQLHLWSIASTNANHLKLRFYFSVYATDIRLVLSSNRAAKGGPMTPLSCRLPWLVAWLDRRSSRRADRSPTVGTAPVGVAPGSDVSELEERRAEALRRMFPKLFNWYASASEWRAAVDVQNYLAAASNVTDLENRIRIVEQRRRFHT